jgi:hypothetical protein
MCPVDTISSTPVTQLTLDVWKNDPNGIHALACVTFNNGFGGACSPADTNTGTGIQHPLVTPGSVWTNNPTGYRFLLVNMLRGIGSNRNSLFGYRKTN